MDFIEYGAFEAYDGVWSLSRNKITIWIVDSSNNKTKVSSYKLADQDDDIVLKGTKPYGRIRIFRKKKFYLKKS